MTVGVADDVAPLPGELRVRLCLILPSVSTLTASCVSKKSPILASCVAHNVSSYWDARRKWAVLNICPVLTRRRPLVRFGGWWLVAKKRGRLSAKTQISTSTRLWRYNFAGAR